MEAIAVLWKVGRVRVRSEACLVQQVTSTVAYWSWFTAETAEVAEVYCDNITLAISAPSAISAVNTSAQFRALILVRSEKPGVKRSRLAECLERR